MQINPLKVANSAIHTVNATFPSISTTKTYRMIKDIGEKHKISPYLITQPIFCNPDAFCNRDKTSIQKHVLTIYKWFSKFMNDFADMRHSRFSLRENPLGYVTDIFEEVEKMKLANCEENAIITAIVLKSRGVKNACTAALTTDRGYVDHVVTVFNKDDSEFTGKIINNKTVVVDSWLGIADYAGNYFSKHRGQCGNFVKIPEGKIGFRNVRKYDLEDKQMEELKKRYPEILKAK